MKIIKLPSAKERRAELIRRLAIGLLILLLVGGGVAWWWFAGRGQQELSAEDTRPFEQSSEAVEAATQRYADREKYVKVDSLPTAEEKYAYYVMQADDLKIMGRFADAVTALENAGKVGIELEYQYYMALALAHEGNGNNELALRNYEKAYSLAREAKYEVKEDRQTVLDSISLAIERTKQ